MNPREHQDIHALLAAVPFVRGACELDLLIFFYRHPHSILTNEQLSALVGYDAQEIATSTDKFIEAGLLERAQNPMHAARMYLLLLEGGQKGTLRALLDLACTHQGRRDILQLLFAGRSDPPEGQAERRLHFVA
jgi:DNA-binding MarR family transcriptional regulator